MSTKGTFTPSTGTITEVVDDLVSSDTVTYEKWDSQSTKLLSDSDLIISDSVMGLTDTTEVVPEDAGSACSFSEADSVLLGKRTPHESDTVGSMVMQVQV
jgi:hypothetical protein